MFMKIQLLSRKQGQLNILMEQVQRNELFLILVIIFRELLL